MVLAVDLSHARAGSTGVLSSHVWHLRGVCRGSWSGDTSVRPAAGFLFFSSPLPPRL